MGLVKSLIQPGAALFARKFIFTADIRLILCYASQWLQTYILIHKQKPEEKMSLELPPQSPAEKFVF